MNSILKLRDFCAALPPGPVADVRTLEPLLAAVWHTLPSDDPSMERYKLLGRMEAVAWDAPVLNFRIERHGTIALGSSRASIDAWTVDIDQMTTSVEKGVGRRFARSRRGSK